MTVGVIPIHREHADIDATISGGGDGKAAGLHYAPAAEPAAAAPPVDADAADVETDFTVGSGERALPGTLAMPKDADVDAGVPAGVLVHGSGPHDRDESIGPNKPFLDIARGLAAQGIAVLHSAKRQNGR